MGDTEGCAYTMAVVSFHAGACGDGWCIPDTVTVCGVVDRDRSEQLATARRSNGWRCAVIEWGNDLPGGDVHAIDNCRVRRALDLPVRHFRVDDDGVTWWIVAVNLDHAKELLRRNCDAFGQEGVSFDKAILDWVELTAEAVDTVTRCSRETRDGVVTAPLSQCHIGDVFCSEY